MIFKTDQGDFVNIETLLYYDGPKLTVCIDAAGQHYLGQCLDEKDEEKMDIWHLIPINQERLDQFLNGTISLRDAVLGVEGGTILDITVPWDDSKGTVTRREVKSLDETELPGPNARLRRKRKSE